MKGKFDKYWDCYNVVLACAIVLDPRYKLDYVDFNFKKIHPIEENTSVFEKRRYRPPIAALFKALVLSRCNRISYTSVFKKRWYRLIYYSGS